MTTATDDNIPHAFRGLARLTELLSIVTAAAGVALAANGFFEFKSRVIYWCVLGVLFSLAALQYRAPASSEGLRPSRRDPRWWAGAIGCVVALAIDVAIHQWYPQPLAEVRGPVFGEDDRSVTSVQSAAPVGFEAVYPRVNQRPNVPANKMASDSREWWKLTEQEQVDLVFARSRLFVDKVDILGPMTWDAARDLYGEHMGEHFGFRVRKGADISEVVLDDVEVTVHKFLACPPPVTEKGTQFHRNIIVVELWQKVGEQLPWKFPAKYLLPDPEKLTVVDWQRGVVSIQDDFEHSYLVKIGARDSGIYVYTVDLIVRANLDHTQRIPLVSTPRTVFFYGSTTAHPTEHMKLWKRVSELTQSSDGVPQPSAPAASPAPAAPIDPTPPATPDPSA